MPYVRRKKFYRKKRYVKKAPGRMATYGAAASQLWKDVQSIKGLINTEWKLVEASATTAPQTSGYFTLLNGIAQGDDYTQRQGRSVLLKSLEMKHYMNSNSGAVKEIIRCICFIDREPAGVAPTVAQVLDQTSGFANYVAFRNLNFRKRFKIIQDQTTCLNEGTSNEGVFKKWYFPLNFHTIYGSTGNTISSINEGALYCLLISNYDSPNSPNVNMTFRVRFIDN